MKLPFLLFASSIHYGLLSASPIFEEFFSSESGRKGAVASEAQECSYIGRDLLARGVRISHHSFRVSAYQVLRAMLSMP